MLIFNTHSPNFASPNPSRELAVRNTKGISAFYPSFYLPFILRTELRVWRNW